MYIFKLTAVTLQAKNEIYARCYRKGPVNLFWFQFDEVYVNSPLNVEKKHDWALAQCPPSGIISKQNERVTRV
jgi:hypothetical protein